MLQKLLHEIVVFLCLQLEEGEIDVRFNSFKGCVLEKVPN